MDHGKPGNHHSAQFKKTQSISQFKLLSGYSIQMSPLTCVLDSHCVESPALTSFL